ncbi:TMEM175 family protein [Lactiplantibacillus fabifermentans]|uniref:Integral membrane protein n=2 Tax=Lactiplantibacillus fabifermentans TaxID=483011 RepID=A0A0R2NMJ9_9LACO|nr:TMEM175 family protein [Lactiplantibacillus fabifermentans]ETY74746.1 hypothetical protein LFAB_05635 [Lactiplantibacillus fabifermentans T30PCM01]KRO26910.1 hypothetical protein DY78_GL000476 [Lactiplantibacillus fabifermentans DSM 21115]
MFRNSRSRLLAFSDGVFAVILTVLVLEIRLPTGRNLWSKSWQTFGIALLTYVAGFSLVSTYWYFHQQLFSKIKHVTGKLIVLNFYFLFFISLMPILTQLIAQDPFSKFRSFMYGLVYLVFNIYLWWLFGSVSHLHRQRHWSANDQQHAHHEIKVVRDTVVVGAIACLSALIWAPLTPLVLALSPLIRDRFKASK